MIVVIVWVAMWIGGLVYMVWPKREQVYKRGPWTEEDSKAIQNIADDMGIDLNKRYTPVQQYVVQGPSLLMITEGLRQKGITVQTVEEEQEPEMKIVNIARNHPDPLIWFPCTHKNLPDPSPAEQLIIDELRKYHVKWHREISFQGLQINSYSHPRYDIMIECSRSPVGIVLVEYDGSAYHQSPWSKAMDKLKNKFCKDNGIPLHRYCKKHYYYMDVHIGTLMKEYGIRKRSI